jgi:hypothetical protein
VWLQAGVGMGVLLNQLFPSWLITFLLILLMVGVIHDCHSKTCTWL